MKCEDCRYYGSWEDGSGLGFCRRYPPRLPNEDEEGSDLPPTVNEVDWCGEFKEKQGGI